MSKQTTKNLVPRLRFPQFLNAGDWVEKLLGDVFRERSDKGYPEKTVLSATQDKGVIPYELLEKSVIRDKKNLVGYKLVKNGDYVISLRSFEGGFEYSAYEGIISPAYVVLERIQNINDYFYQVSFKADSFITAIQNCLNHSLRDGKSISYTQAKNLLLVAPRLPEQQKIAECLSSIDDLITVQTQKLTTLKIHKKGLMQQLFPLEGETVPKRRFSEFHDAGEWEEKPFNKVFKRITTKNAENNQNVLTISAQNGLVSQLDYFNKSVSAKDVTGYYLLHKGDFAYNKSYSQGYPMGAIKPLKSYNKGVVSTLYICFRANKDYNGSFFEYYFDAGMLNGQIEKIAQEGARNHGLLNISVVDFFEITQVFVPDIEEQKKIVDCLSSIDDLIFNQTLKLEAFKAQKKGLMQQLFPSADEVLE